MSGRPAAEVDEIVWRYRVATTVSFGCVTFALGCVALTILGLASCAAIGCSPFGAVAETLLVCPFLGLGAALFGIIAVIAEPEEGRRLYRQHRAEMKRLEDDREAKPQ